MYQAIATSRDKTLEHTVYISGPYLEEVFKWIAKPKLGGHTKLILNPVPTSTIPLQQDGQPRACEWKVSEVIFTKKRSVSVQDWENHRHEIDLGELNITAELSYLGLEVYRCISYGPDGTPRIFKDFIGPQPPVAREPSHLPLALVKMNTVSPPHLPPVATQLHPFAGSIQEIHAWKRRASMPVFPHTLPRKQCRTKPGGDAGSSAKKARCSLTPAEAAIQPSVTSFLQPQPSSSTTVIGIIQQQAASGVEFAAPGDDEISDMVLQLEDRHERSTEQDPEEEQGDEGTEEEEAT